jgi:cytochrome c oxidase assembly protein Cox11
MKKMNKQLYHEKLFRVNIFMKYYKKIQCKCFHYLMLERGWMVDLFDRYYNPLELIQNTFALE